jgi:hypothetical protein
MSESRGGGGFIHDRFFDRHVLAAHFEVAAFNNRPDAARDNGIFFRAETTRELLTNQTGTQAQCELELEPAGADRVTDALYL